MPDTTLSRLRGRLASKLCTGAQYDVNSVFWLSLVPFSTLTTAAAIDAHRHECSAAELVEVCPSNRYFMLDCPGCGRRQCTTSSGIQGGAFFCTSGVASCPRRRVAGTAPPTSAYAVAKELLVAHAQLCHEPVDDIRNVHSKFSHRCLSCGTTATDSLQSFRLRSRCVSPACETIRTPAAPAPLAGSQALPVPTLADAPPGAAEDAARDAVPVSREVGQRMFLKNADYAADARLLGLTLAPPPLNYRSAFTITCAHGHETPGCSLQALKRWATRQTPTHPCSTCATDLLWASLLVKLDGVGISFDRVLSTAADWNHNMARTVIAVVCEQGHQTTAAASSFFDQVRNRADQSAPLWHCAQCSFDATMDSRAKALAGKLHEKGAKLLRLDWPEKRVHFRCYNGHEEQLALSTVADDSWQGCPVCLNTRMGRAVATTRAASTLKPHTLFSGQQVMVQGYEGVALDWLMLERQVAWSDIVYGDAVAEHLVLERTIGNQRQRYGIPDISTSPAASGWSRSRQQRLLQL